MANESNPRTILGVSPLKRAPVTQMRWAPPPMVVPAATDVGPAAHGVIDAADPIAAQEVPQASASASVEIDDDAFASQVTHVAPGRALTPARIAAPTTLPISNPFPVAAPVVSPSALIAAQSAPGAMPSQYPPAPVSAELPVAVPTQTSQAYADLEVQDDSAGRGWTVFRKIGLGHKQPAHATAKKLAVSSYRLVGFGLLTMIVIALLGYVTLTVFYLFSTSWVTPIAMSPNDEKVVAVTSALATQRNERDRTAADLADTVRAIQAHEQFQVQLLKTIETDLAGRKASLARVRSLAAAASSARSKIAATSAAFAADHAGRIDSQYGAGLIDQSTLLAEKQRLAQISSSSLNLAERQASLEQQAAKLALEAKGLDALLDETRGDATLSYEVLTIKRELDASKRELAKAVSNRGILETALARQDEIIKGLERSPYLRAISGGATVALVPYDNLGNVKAGTDVHACRVAMLICRKVGTVTEILPGEVPLHHPHRDKAMRGQMVVLKLTETDAATKDVLFLGGAPLLF